MFNKAVSAAIALAALSTPVAAQFAGGEFTIDAFNYDDNVLDTTVDYSVALEYAISQRFGIAADLSTYDFSITDDTITSFALHGIYHLNNQSSLGVVAGRESVGDDTVVFAGLEGGFESNQFSGEGYFALYDDSDSSAVLGVSGAYQITNSLSAIAEFGVGSFNDNDITRISAGAEYDFANGPSVYAELGNVDSDVADSAFIGLGASFEFGAARGTTFDRRSVFETLLPGL